MEGRVIKMLWGFVSASSRWTAAATATFAALVSAAETIEDACQHSEKNHRANDDADDNWPPVKISPGANVFTYGAHQSLGVGDSLAV